jgi:DNA repair protein RadA/Sms
VPTGLQALEAATIVAALEHMLDIAEHRANAPASPHRLDVAQNDWQ